MEGEGRGWEERTESFHARKRRPNEGRYWSRKGGRLFSPALTSMTGRGEVDSDQ